MTGSDRENKTHDLEGEISNLLNTNGVISGKFRDGYNVEAYGEECRVVVLDYAIPKREQKVGERCVDPVLRIISVRASESSYCRLTDEFATLVRDGLDGRIHDF